MLAPHEYGRLAHTGLAAIPAHTPAGTVIAVEEDGRVVGTLLVGSALHVEGAWIDPTTTRRVGVGRRLWDALQRVAAMCGVESVIVATEADAEPARSLLRKQTQPLPACGLLRVRGRRRR